MDFYYFFVIPSAVEESSFSVLPIVIEQEPNASWRLIQRYPFDFAQGRLFLLGKVSKAVACVHLVYESA